MLPFLITTLPDLEENLQTKYFRLAFLTNVSITTLLLSLFESRSTVRVINSGIQDCEECSLALFFGFHCIKEKANQPCKCFPTFMYVCVVGR